MAKATRVHSTPRRTAPKIKPIPQVQQPATKERICGQSYRSLESQVTECFLQAEVAAIVVHDTLSDAEPSVTADTAMAVTHAVYQLVADVRALHAQYYEYLASAGKAVQS